MLKIDNPGYNYGTAEVPTSPYSMEELTHLEQSVMFTAEDSRYLRMAGDVLTGSIEEILDIWYGFIGSHPFLVKTFAGPDGQPNQHYLQSVRERFGQWILDTCYRTYDQDWLNYQHEIALRHAPEKKNLTDGVQSTPYVPLRYTIALIYPVTATIRPFLARGGHSEEDVDKMHQAWFKSVTMQIALWSEPHVRKDKISQPEIKPSM